MPLHKIGKVGIGLHIYLHRPLKVKLPSIAGHFRSCRPMKILLLFLLLLAIGVCGASQPIPESSASSDGGPASAMPIEFTRPEITPSTVKIYRTKSRHLHISGSNFPSTEGKYKLVLTFEPELREDVDYTMKVASTTQLDVTLLDDRAWCTEPGQLSIKSINILDKSVGFNVFLPESGAWQVAEVVEDANPRDRKLDESNDDATADFEIGT